MRYLNEKNLKDYLSMLACKSLIILAISIFVGSLVRALYLDMCYRNFKEGFYVGYKDGKEEFNLDSFDKGFIAALNTCDNKGHK